MNKNVCFLLFQHLMASENSPIIEYYPHDFKTDLNGKQQEWEAVVLIPFIDEVYTHNNDFSNRHLSPSVCVCVIPK